MAFKRTFTDPVPEDNRQQYAEKGIEQQRRAASEEFLSERSRYKMQLASLLDVSTAEAGKAAAETSYERTEFDYERARAALQFATGGAPGPH
jgi:outer membrane protein TolC